MEPVLPEKRLIRCNSWTDGNSPDGRNEMAGCFGNAKIRNIQKNLRYFESLDMIIKALVLPDRFLV